MSMFVCGGTVSRELGLLPPPLAGEGWGGGERALECLLCMVWLRLHAPSLAPPRKRGRERTESVALNCFNHK
jgi:hypothetical protein